jgi:hypothetical protein
MFGKKIVSDSLLNAVKGITSQGQKDASGGTISVGDKVRIQEGPLAGRTGSISGFKTTGKADVQINQGRKVSVYTKSIISESNEASLDENEKEGYPKGHPKYKENMKKSKKKKKDDDDEDDEEETDDEPGNKKDGDIKVNPKIEEAMSRDEINQRRRAERERIRGNAVISRNNDNNRRRANRAAKKAGVFKDRRFGPVNPEKDK